MAGQRAASSASAGSAAERRPWNVPPAGRPAPSPPIRRRIPKCHGATPTSGANKTVSAPAGEPPSALRAAGVRGAAGGNPHPAEGSANPAPTNDGLRTAHVLQNAARPASSASGIRRLCAACGAQQWRAERERYARARATGRRYGGKDPVGKRNRARRRSRKAMRPARNEIIVCTGLRTRGGVQVWGDIATGLFHDRKQW